MIKNVLVACEESQAVCMAFRSLGLNAFSCDLQECSGDLPQYHVVGDVLPLLNGHCSFITQTGEQYYIETWDLLIAHPPCTYLTKAGSNLLFNSEHEIKSNERYILGVSAYEFFMKFYNSDIERICIENPVPMSIFGLPPYTQIIQPYYFGHPYKKTTCLWLKNLPKLLPTDLLAEKCASPCMESSWFCFNHSRSDRAKNRSKTFPGIASAMAEQWSEPLFLF